MLLRPLRREDSSTYARSYVEGQAREQLVDQSSQRPRVPPVDGRVGRRLLRHRDHGLGQRARAPAPSRRAPPSPAALAFAPADTQGLDREPGRERFHRRGCRNGENCATPETATEPSTFALLWPGERVAVERRDGSRSSPATAVARRTRVVVDRSRLAPAQHPGVRRRQRDVVEIASREVTAAPVLRAPCSRATSAEARDMAEAALDDRSREHAEHRVAAPGAGDDDSRATDRGPLVHGRVSEEHRVATVAGEHVLMTVRRDDVAACRVCSR